MIGGVRNERSILYRRRCQKENFRVLSESACELKVCTTKKPENPSVFLTLPVAHELSVLCMI